MDTTNDRLLESLLREKFAYKLGLTVYELDLLDWNAEEVLSEDGLRYTFRLNVGENLSDRDTYTKIASHLINGNTANLDHM
ncbi:hypothetical protein OFO16_13000 [Vibrio natriegens]|uniref:hypothetical protein n=1 Tax=Vibrio natriegens TaxID=691 RepID=UPI0021E6E998|nr:hypothetical protein [Vibrio natriegens]UYI46710.1 hypothetical protein OFO16_13000 [Vibrio natriegens]